MLLSSYLFVALTALTVATTLPSPLLVTYWGQDAYANQKSLGSYCDLGYNGV